MTSARTRETRAHARTKTNLIVKHGTHVPLASTLCAWHTMQNVCEEHFLKNGFIEFAIRTLQNEVFLHFFSKKFGQFKKKLYLCTGFLKGNLIGIT